MLRALYFTVINMVMTIIMLTHLPHDKMAAILQTIFSYAFLMKISLKVVPDGAIDNNPALV